MINLLNLPPPPHTNDAHPILTLFLLSFLLLLLLHPDQFAKSQCSKYVLYGHSDQHLNMSCASGYVTCALFMLSIFLLYRVFMNLEQPFDGLGEDDLQCDLSHVIDALDQIEPYHVEEATGRVVFKITTTT